MNPDNRPDAVKTIFDPLRKKRVKLTPEESVRQAFIAWLIRERNYPQMLMASEYAFRYNRRIYRCDIIVFTRDLKPFLLVECKAPEVKMDRETIDQAVRYNRVLQVPHIVFTNGISTFVCRRDPETSEYGFVSDIPFYPRPDEPEVRSGISGSKYGK